MEDIFNELSTKGIVVAHEDLKSGANNSVIKMKSACEQKFFALKIYDITRNPDSRDRIEHEIDFLSYCDKEGVQNLPKAYMKGKTKNKLWLLIEWIEGIKIKKLKKEDIKAIAKFYMQTNQSLNSNNKEKSFRLAKESIKNHQSMYDQIIKRLKETKKRIREDRVPEGLRTWMMEELIPKTYQRLEEYIKCDKKECWDKENMKQLLSQSDVGIHNIINQKGIDVYQKF